MFFSRRLMRKAPALVFLAALAFSFGARAVPVPPVTAVQGAQTTTAITCNISGTVVPCEALGAANSVRSFLASGLKDALKDSARELENKLSELDNDMVKAMLTRLNATEKDIISWWDTFWTYNLYGSYQNVTNQLNATTAIQSQVTQNVIDAQSQEETKKEQQQTKIAANQTAAPNENACADASVVGGVKKATNIAKNLNVAWERRGHATGSNKKGGKGATGKGPVLQERNDDYEKIFCNKNANGGNNKCGEIAPENEKYVDADTQPSNFIYGQTTIPVDPESDPQGNMRKTIEAEVDNMIGVTAADPISEGALNSQPGQETFLARRSYLARHAAIGSVPRHIIGWRMPGSKVGEWVKGLQNEEGANIPLEDISKNPSYREIVRAVSVDRFNSGHYAVGMIKDEAAIEQEKLILNAFYLMQLRDYYELLERTALVLAVQVAMMVDETPVPSTAAFVPTRQKGE